MNRSVRVCLVLSAALAVAGAAAAHCQIPCGIYGDELRVQLLEEHVTTVEKSMRRIAELGAADAPDWNQLVRWVDNKETHAQEIQDIVTSYFLAQRLTHPGTDEGDAWEGYVRQLTVLHRIQVAAMKAKQTTDLGHVATLRSLISEFRKLYFGDDGGHTHGG